MAVAAAEAGNPATATAIAARDNLARARRARLARSSRPGPLTQHRSFHPVNLGFQFHRPWPTGDYQTGARRPRDGPSHAPARRCGGTWAPTGAGGGAIYAYQADLTVTDTTFADNRADGPGGAIYAVLRLDFGTSPPTGLGGSLAVHSSTFLGNASVTDSGGAVAAIDVSATVSGRIFAGNTAGFGGGAIYTTRSFESDAALVVEGSTFIGNSAVSPDSFALGGAIFNLGEVAVQGSTFIDNRAVAQSIAQGGAIHNSFSAIMMVEDSHFVGNLARADSPFGSSAGGALSGDSGSSITVDGSTFTGNRVETSGFQSHGGAIKSSGGGFGPTVGTLTISDSLFLANAAVGLDATQPFQSGVGAQGGGVFNEEGPVLISDTTFLGNRARGSDAAGGGLWAGGIVAILDTRVTGNRAEARPGGQAFGGGIFLDNPDAATIDRKSKITGNKATTAGDDIFPIP